MSRAGLFSRSFAAGLFCAFLLAAPAEAAPVEPRQAEAAVPTLEALLERCAKSPGLFAQFTEDKQIALLAVPLKSEGTIHFSPSRGLVRHTTKPAPQSALVTDKELVFWDGKTVKRMSLTSSPTLETFARAFAMLLTANRAALEKSFTLAFRPLEGDAWSLKLTPTGADLKKLLDAIELEGRGVELGLLRVRETNGDVSTTRFTAVDTQKRYSDAEADKVFRVPPT